ncbi:hypothetical protein ACFWXO_13735 [Kitasatospora sp. NPDC059088]|uniref:hypothetical protein n=1 Tax=Kitasatospora sp. NPDC059088 TaxID=3346722 RepID=UPI00368A6B7B
MTIDEKQTALALAEGLLKAELHRRLLAEPQNAVALVAQLVLSMHGEALAAGDMARRRGLDFETIGRALALVEDAGILLQQATAMLLGLPTAGPDALQELRAALVEPDSAGPDGEGAVGGPDPDPDVWAAAVNRFRMATGGRRPTSNC